MESFLQFFNFQNSIPEIVLIGMLIITFLIQMYFYLAIYRKFSFHKKCKNEIKNHPLSVVICAKNEEVNLENNLTFVLEQDYPDFEVIVVNDGSWDETESVLARYKEKYCHLKVTKIPEEKKFHYGKKLAITVGIKAASNEWIVFTDADCKPSSKYWLRNIQQNIKNNSSIILGYGKYEIKKGFLNKFIRFDTLFIAMKYFSYAINGNAYMGIGRNLAYKKTLFFNNKGFANHLKLSSGDDDLFINETATSNNVEIEYSHDSHTISEPKLTFTDWANQKRRHLTTGFYYKAKHKFLLTLENVSLVLFYSTIFSSIIYFNLLGFFVSAFILRLTVQLIITKKAMILLNEKNLLLYSPLLELMLPFLYLYFVMSSYFIQKRNRWK
ncbi:MAG: hypothetical protein A2046_16740 [Bacteroidetes bacterium GWA2_30_7]|nr:MAG: hypothetical protein A2046_16740 [Bacteroidetes bacterium GWA2_30_7]